MDLRARYQRMTDAELLDVAVGNPALYRPESKAIARELLAARGVDVSAVAARIDDQAAEQRAQADLEAERHRAAAAAMTATLRAEADAVGSCLRCRAAPATEAVHLMLRGPTSTRSVGSYSVIESPAFPLEIPVCADCAAGVRPALREPSRWLGGLGGLALIALAVAVVGLFNGSWLVALVGLAGTTLIVPLLLRIQRRTRAAGALYDAHPGAPRLRAGGLQRAEPRALDAGASERIDSLVQRLRVDQDLALDASTQLVAIGTSEVIDAVIAELRLAHSPLAVRRACDVVVALRAHGAEPALREAMQARDPDVRLAARDALENLGLPAPSYPDVALPRARVVPPR